MSAKLQVTLVKSKIGKTQKHCDTIAGLGLKRLNQTVVLADTPEVRGMIAKVSYMLNIA